MYSLTDINDIKRGFLSVLIAASLIVPLHAETDLPETNDKLLLQLLQHQKERVVSRQPWRPIQEEVHDTVVQIFAQIAELDILQPYKTPSQYGVRGSGFFINDRGDIITNAHVVEQAVSIWIQIPSLGRRPISAYVIGICPDRDLAIVRVADEDLELIRSELGMIPYLTLGDSDTIRRADEVLALGYPLGQESLKSTTGVISGREKNLIQMSAPINPGSSGGPLLNIHGEVIGINTSGITEAQNIGYIIPINDLKIILPDLYKVPLLRKPFMGIITENATDTLTTFLNNPHPGGCYVVDVVKDSPVYKAGLKQGDMIYEINGYPVDIYGDMRVPWSEDKVSIGNFISRLALGETVEMKVFRSGQKLEFNVQLNHSDPLPIRKIYPGYEPLDYEVIGGMVVMELTINHIKYMISQAPGLARFTETKNQTEPVLVITHIFPTSQLFRSRTLMPAFTLNEINGIEVKTLSDFRDAVTRSKNYLTIKASDNVAKSSDNIFVVLPFDKVLDEEPQLSQTFHYPMTEMVTNLYHQEFR